MENNGKIFFNAFRTGKESAMESFRSATDFLKNVPGVDLIVEPGEYYLGDEMSVNALNNVMTGKYGYNPQKAMFNPDYKYTVGINFEGIKDRAVIAKGVKLIVDGFMEPIFN